MKGGQGQSAATIDKERRIAACLSVGMKIAEAKFGKTGFGYWHFDANAGSGWNEKVNVPGSPLVFWHVANAYLRGLQPRAFFCDHDPRAMAKLQMRLRGQPSPSVLLACDNEDAMEAFADSIRRRENPRFAVGSMLFDPNGYFNRSRNGNGPPIAPLDRFLREFPRIDLILNLNMRTYRLQRGADHDVLPPAELFALLGKEQWLVGRTYVGQSRFMIAIGRNVTTGDHRKIGLYELGSEAGQRIVRDDPDADQGLLGFG